MVGIAPACSEVTLDVYYHRFFWILENLNRTKNILENTTEYTTRSLSESIRSSERRDLWV